MVEKASQDYSKLLQTVSLDNEINPICMNIEDMLARLDELESLLVNVKSENSIIMDQYASSVLSFDPLFENLKERVDQLESFVEIVSNNVDAVEKSVDIAEEELNVTDFSFKGLLLKPLLAKAKSVSESNALVTGQEPSEVSNIKDGNFQAIPIFSTIDVFNSQV